MKKLTSYELKALSDISKKLNIPVQWLQNIINFESGFNPFAINKKSGAMGLIQFMPKTAKSLGFYSPAFLVTSFPTIETQIRGPVYAYLRKHKPFTTEQNFYLSIFYPAYRNVFPLKQFPEIVKKYNPGINTPYDYICKIKKYNGLSCGEFSFKLVLLGVGLYLIYNKFKGKGK